MGRRGRYAIHIVIIVIVTSTMLVKGTRTIVDGVEPPQIIGEQPTAPDDCTSVIVTGTAAEDGRPILMKNRDLDETYNVPVYSPGNDYAYAYVAVNLYSMGINERGLAVMNTYMPALAESGEAGYWNGHLNALILQLCESVVEVDAKLRDPESPIGPVMRTNAIMVATCVGVIDRFGYGAFFEISNSQVYTEYVTNGYQSRANHPRIFEGLASGPSGRDQYALNALDAIYAERGVISWKDVAQEVSRCVRGDEEGENEFGISGEICNDNTVAAMVALSGDRRYDGKLNVMWGEYGQVPMIGVFVPSISTCGEPPEVLEQMVSFTEEKRMYAGPEYYDPVRVRTIQNYAFAAEEYEAQQYDSLIQTISDDLSNEELRDELSEFVSHSVRVAVDMYVNETDQLPPYITHPHTTTTGMIETTTTTQIHSPVTSTSTFASHTTPTIATTVTSALPATSTPTSHSNSPPLTIELPLLVISSCIIGVIVVVLFLRRRK